MTEEDATGGTRWHLFLAMCRYQLEYIMYKESTLFSKPLDQLSRISDIIEAAVCMKYHHECYPELYGDYRFHCRVVFYLSGKTVEVLVDRKQLATLKQIFSVGAGSDDTEMDSDTYWYRDVLDIPVGFHVRISLNHSGSEIHV